MKTLKQRLKAANNLVFYDGSYILRKTLETVVEWLRDHEKTETKSEDGRVNRTQNRLQMLRELVGELEE